MGKGTTSSNISRYKANSVTIKVELNKRRLGRLQGRGVYQVLCMKYSLIARPKTIVISIFISYFSLIKISFCQILLSWSRVCHTLFKNQNYNIGVWNQVVLIYDKEVKKCLHRHKSFWPSHTLFEPPALHPP